MGKKWHTLRLDPINPTFCKPHLILENQKLLNLFGPACESTHYSFFKPYHIKPKIILVAQPRCELAHA